MHPAVLRYVQRFASDAPLDVLDIGGRDVNGTVRHLFPAARFLILDLREGPGVDLVADAADWQPDKHYDLVVCTEVFEHTERWRDICRTAYKALKPGGRLVVTCAAPGRHEHSGIDGGGLHRGEHYENVAATDLAAVLYDLGFRDVTASETDFDTQATAVR